MGRLVARIVRTTLAGIVVCAGVTFAQEATIGATVPRVIQFSGVLKNSAGQPLAGVQGVQFALYREQEGGAPLWIESQNVAADEYGRFAVLLGAATVGGTSGGLPVELFASGESRWLGVQPQVSGESEMPRVLLVSVPYALKAADAETIGGLPPSAFVLAADAVTERVKDSGGLTVAAVSDGVSDGLSDGLITAQANAGVAGFIGKFIDATDLDSSAFFQLGSNIGQGTTTPESALHIQGATTDGITMSNGLNSGIGFLRFKRADGAIAGEIRSLLGTQAMVFNATGAERMRIAPSGFVGIGTNSPIAQLHVSGPGSTRMLFQGNAGTNGVIGLDMDSTARRWTLGAQGTNENGAFILFDFTAGQRRMTVDSSGRFGIGKINPSTALDVNGTVTATAFVGDGSMLTGIASTGGTNTFVGTQTISGGNLALPDTADATEGVLTLGGNRFLHSFGNENTFLGQNAGNFTMTAGRNTAIGREALTANTEGNRNTAVGRQALMANTTGDRNTAIGESALSSNTTGVRNSAVGRRALTANTIGNSNNATGSFALDLNTEGSSNTANGADALRDNTIGSNNTGIGREAGRTLDPANSNITGSNNTFVGYQAGPGVDGTTTPLTNATAIGANAVVSASNSLVLGSINGVNGAGSDVNVGIGIAAPAAKLQVEGGDVYLSAVATGIILKSPDGVTCTRISIDNAGALVTTVLMSCP